MQTEIGWAVIDWTISVGNILNIIAFISAGVVAFQTLRSDVRILDNRMEALEKEQASLTLAMTQLTTVLTTLATQQVRLERAEKTIDELRHGQGYVNPMSS